MSVAVPAGTESARPFLPARDFVKSKAFYEALGFAKELDSDDVAIFRVGSTSFCCSGTTRRSGPRTS